MSSTKKRDKEELAYRDWCSDFADMFVKELDRLYNLKSKQEKE